MSLAIIHSRAQVGIDAPLVTVEAHISNGLPKLSIVGLPEAVVKESKDRVRSALLNSHFEFPARRITINLAPADLPKEGGRFDLPIALGILAASKQIPVNRLLEFEFAGELALSGEIRPIRGTLPFALKAQQQGKILIVPAANADEASLIKNIQVLPARHLLDVCAHLTGQKFLQPHQCSLPLSNQQIHPDIADVKGQHQAKRALLIAAAGGHSLLMKGTPGAGKTMLASRLLSVLPPLTEQEAIDIAVIKSLAKNGLDLATWCQRPFRAPHHTVSSVALVGGSNPPQPGEISLAHQGVLFLDELPEFNHKALEALREPLESGTIIISRAACQVEFPARFQLIAAMNPCPCGHAQTSNFGTRCQCTTEQVKRYQNRISGPLLDRIDLHVQVSPLPISEISRQAVVETSAELQEQATQARQKQLQRSGKPNCLLQGKELITYCSLNESTQQLLTQAIDKFNLSARAYQKVLRVARTIADLSAKEHIDSEHLAEALTYRYLR